MPPRRDLEKEARLAKYVKRTLDWEFRKAAIHRDKIRSGVEGEKRWDERTVRDVWSLKVMELEAASKRAAQGGTQVLGFGLVAFVEKEPDKAKWEQMAADAGRPVIEAVATPKKDEP